MICTFFKSPDVIYNCDSFLILVSNLVGNISFYEAFPFLYQKNGSFLSPYLETFLYELFKGFAGVTRPSSCGIATSMQLYGVFGCREMATFLSVFISLYSLRNGIVFLALVWCYAHCYLRAFFLLLSLICKEIGWLCFESFWLQLFIFFLNF